MSFADWFDRTVAAVSPEVAGIMARAEFSPVHTGGGCWAWENRDEVMICTDDNKLDGDPDASEWIAGHHTEDHGFIEVGRLTLWEALTVAPRLASAPHGDRYVEGPDAIPASDERLTQPQTFDALPETLREALRSHLATFHTEVFVTPKIDGCHAGSDTPEDWSVDLFLFGKDDLDIRNSIDIRDGIPTREEAFSLAESVALALYGDASLVTDND